MWKGTLLALLHIFLNRTPTLTCIFKSGGFIFDFSDITPLGKIILQTQYKCIS
jgi:hypothetical protein